MINTKLVEVTPKMAAEMLTHNPSNRKIRIPHVNRLKLEILSGRWLLTHQGIAFDEDGNLLDGQHRLMAVEAAGKPAQMFVTRGVPKSKNGHGSLTAMDVIDCGKSRTVGDQLRVSHGYDNYNLTAACARMIAEAFTNHSKASRSQTVGQALGVLEIYGDYINHFIRSACGNRLCNKAPVISATVIAYHVSPETTDTFFSHLLTGSGIKNGDPVYALREHMIKFPMKHGQEERYNMLLRVAQAIYNTIEGTPIKLSKISSYGLEYFMSKQPKAVKTVKSIVLG